MPNVRPDDKACFFVSTADEEIIEVILHSINNKSRAGYYMLFVKYITIIEESTDTTLHKLIDMLSTGGLPEIHIKYLFTKRR